MGHWSQPSAHGWRGLPGDTRIDSTPPQGTITVLFTDIEGSTSLWERAPESMQEALLSHDSILRESIAEHGGHVFKTIGDAFCAAFSSASEALACAVDAQLKIAEQLSIRVRMALNSGTAEARDGDYFGTALNRAARLLSLAHGAQIVLSSAAAGLAKNSLPRDVTLIDLGLNRLRGIDEPERVFQVNHPNLRSEFPALLSPTTFVHNMPRQLTAFIGRDLEVQRWYDLIKDPSRRLLTITGFGGLGKTRIAMHLAELCLEDFADSVWWCELEEARTADEMVTRICSQLRVPLQPSPAMIDQLCQFIREKNLLVVLDNTEQVTDAANVVRDLLKDAPAVKCLLTSRRTLELRGETVLELAPLEIEESTALFVSRSTACRPDFELNDDNLADVTELCGCLEGVPLALELAAARMVGMAPREILARLGERFRLLQSRSPELSDRQRALRGAIDWSYSLLSDDDKTVYAQLSVFAGGFSLDDAEAVCDSFDVFESVMELRRHSFFRVATDSEKQQTRFYMLDLLREYAAEKLLELQKDGTDVHRTHAEYFLKYAQDRLNLLRSAGEVGALEELNQNAPNLRTAMEWAQRSDERILWAGLALANGAMYQRHGFLQDAMEAIESGIVAVSGPEHDVPTLRANLYLERAGLFLDSKDPEKARQDACEAGKLLERLSDTLGLARMENLLGQAAMLERNLPEARNRYLEALTQFKSISDPVGIANVLNNLGLAERRDRSGSPGDWDLRAGLAEQHLTESLRIRTELGDRRGLAETLNNLGVLAHERAENLRSQRILPDQGSTEDLHDSEIQQWDLAWQHYHRAIEHYQGLDNTLGIAITLANLGEVAENTGRYQQAVRLHAAAEAFMVEVRSPMLEDVRAMLVRAANAADYSETELAQDQTLAASTKGAARVTWALTEMNAIAGV